MSLLDRLREVYPACKETRITGRYVPPARVQESLFYRHPAVSKKAVGFSVQNRPIELVTVGSGGVKILLWSQMHGNETTTTKAMVDVFNFLHSVHPLAKSVLKNCTLYGIFLLNPDGALAYTRENAHGADLNRDMKNLLQPESQTLRRVFEELEPHFCFNLHDQRSLYGVGNTPKAAIVSFLAPLQDIEGTLTPNRKKAMRLIVAMNSVLQEVIPGHVGRYDDTFNIHCAGDFFQAQGVPTLLMEAGHYGDDYDREKTRQFVFYALIQALYVLSENALYQQSLEEYFGIPENKKTFFDVLVKGVPTSLFPDVLEVEKRIDVGIYYKEVLKNEILHLLPEWGSRGYLSEYYGHQVFDYEENIDEILKNNTLFKTIFPFDHRSYDKFL